MTKTTDQARWFRPPRAHGDVLQDRSVSFIELFYDLVFVLLVPQLFAALFDPRANRMGSITAFVASFVLRLGGGMPLLGLEPFIPYPELFAVLLPISPEAWYEVPPGGVRVMLFPYKTMAFFAGIVLLPCVSRLTCRWNPPRPLDGPAGQSSLDNREP